MTTPGKLVLNNEGFRQLRKSAAVTDMNRSVAEKIAARCGPGFEVHESPSRNRSRFVVVAVTPEAIAKNARENTLVKAMR